MKSRFLLVAALLSSLLACSPSPEPTAATSEPTAATSPAPAAPAAAPAQPEAPAAVSTGATETTPAPAPAPTPKPEVAAPAAPAVALTEGTDFERIPGGTPFAPEKGKIEVVEFFNYICPACNSFHPMLESWLAQQADDVKMVFVPADFRPDFVPYARAYYAAQSFGLAEKAHDAVYKAIHDTHIIPAEGDTPNNAAVAAFYAQFGASAELFEGAMRSFAVDNKIRQGREFMVRSKVASTPSLVINGKYLVKGRSFEDKLRIASALIARERAAR
jgi:protein dithiol oxidoreductase (disulfide-forming)